MTYKYLGSLEESVPPANSDVSNINDWQLINNEIYSRDVSEEKWRFIKTTN